MLAEKPTQGLAEHHPHLLVRKLGEIHDRNYTWPNLGLRFYLNDMVASLWSAVSNVTCSSAIEASSSMFTRSLTIWLIDSLVQRMAQVGPLASSIAISRAFASTSERGTTWLTSPIRSASLPLRSVPRIRNSFALLMPTS